jgi:hypothetical protein
MIDKEKQTLNEKIAKWCGFKYHDDGNNEYWKAPNGDIGQIPNFCDSMDAITKWVFPKLLNHRITLSDFNRDTWVEIKSAIYPAPIYTNASGASISESFCYALSKLIDSEEKK